jgi:hypothetical protein
MAGAPLKQFVGRIHVFDPALVFAALAPDFDTALKQHGIP